MKTFIALAIAFTLSFTVFGGEGKEVTLEGTGLCAKCTLKQADSCTNALEVKTDSGDLKTYIFTANMKHGAHFCKGKNPGLVVTGTVKEVDGKLMLTPKSVEKKEES